MYKLVQKILQGEKCMKKKYIPAEIELLFVSTCDVITESSLIPEPGPGPEGGEGGEGGSNVPGGSIGGGTVPGGGWTPLSNYGL